MIGLAVVATIIAQTGSDAFSAWPASDRATAAAIEARILATPTRDALASWHDTLASEPHVAGTAGDARTIGRIVHLFEGFGLTVERHPFYALLPSPIASSLEILTPEPRTLALRERTLEEDAYTSHPDLSGGWNAFSGSGDVTGEIVYANYGRKEDFETLRSLGVDLTGRIVIARYGGNFRGYKAEFATEAGAAGLLIFTDPADSGYAKGLTYPEGGWANETCIERGSLLTLDYPGDPLTPGTPATVDAPRLNPDDVPMPTIPVQPVAWGAAVEIMKRMRGDAVPAGWQGGLPLAYRVTGGLELRVRLVVEQARRITPSANVIATLEGAVAPEQRVIIGCHHDAWGFGAADPLSGLISLMGAADAFGRLSKEGIRPARTLVFAAWGAEEMGIIGSTEWVESQSDSLARDGVAYLNLDMASMGPDFGASSAPSLRAVITQSARRVPQARDPGKTVFDAWFARAEDPLWSGSPQFGDLGGGSDHIGFWCHALVPSAALGGSGSPGTSYHSIYDNLAWYRKVVGEDYEPALMVSRMTAATAYRLAYAPLIPIDPSRSSVAVRAWSTDAKSAARKAFESAPDDVERVVRSLESLAARAESLDAPLRETMDAALRAHERGIVSGDTLAAVNRMLIDSDRVWRSESGLPGRTWFKNLAASPDEDSGYAAWTLPAVRAAIRDRDSAALEHAVTSCLSVLDALEAIGGRMREIVGETTAAPAR